LTDGSGAFEFLKALLLQYFNASGTTVAEYGDALTPDGRPSPEEFEDGFLKHFRKNIPSPAKKPRSFHLPFKLNGRPRFRILMAKMPLAEIITRSKSIQVSITDRIRFCYTALYDDRSYRVIIS
jgi:hypothetical protein